MTRSRNILALGSAFVLTLAASVAFCEPQAYAQTTPPTTTTTGSDAPAGASPSDTPTSTSDVPAEPVATAPSDSGTTTAHPRKELAPGEQAGIPQSDERRYVRSPAMKKMMQRGTTWDLNLELGYGRIFPSPPHWEGFFRGGAGIMFVRDPLIEVLRFTYDYSPRSNATLGVELEADWVETGLWGNIGLMKDANSKYWGGRASVGFALFGFEAEYRGDDTTKTYWALYGKLRLPLGIIGRALQ